jgi:hypothetical protein
MHGEVMRRHRRASTCSMPTSYAVLQGRATALTHTHNVMTIFLVCTDPSDTMRIAWERREQCVWGSLLTKP